MASAAYTSQYAAVVTTTTTHGYQPPVQPPVPLRSVADGPLQEVADQLGVGPAAGLAHDLADHGPEHAPLAAPELVGQVGVGGHHPLDHGLQLGSVGDLGQALALDNGG